VPQQEPLSPPLLLVGSVLAALPVAWIALAVDAVVAGAAGSLAGIPWAGLSLSPSFIVRPVQAPGGQLFPVLWVVVLFAGPVATAALGFAAHLLAEAAGAAAWLRVAALQWSGFALLRLPALVFAGVAPGGRGLVAELYSRLGEPQSGRWALAPLAVLALGGAAAIVGRRAIATGREWMRVDGRDFRRRLVAVLGGYPSLASLALWCAVAPWAAPGWMAGWLLLTLASVHVLVS
jgi:hypothetical protein